MKDETRYGSGSRFERTLRTAGDLFADEVDIAFFVKDLELTIIQANAAFLRLCGQTDLNLVLGRTDRELFPGCLAEEYEFADREALRQQVRTEIVTLVPDARGIPAWSRVVRSPVRDDSGNIVGVAGVVRGFEATRAAFDSYSGIAVAVEAMERNYRRPLRLADLASMSGMSVRQYERRFRALFGITPQQYTIRLRIITACELLGGSAVPVSTIAERVGFSDHSGFTRHFSRLMGVSPLKYRARRQARAN